MAQVKFTRHLVRYFPDLQDKSEIHGDTVAEIIANLDNQYPGLADYIVDEQGRLRKHVNIFVNGDLIQDREKLTDKVASDHTVYLFQALSGGNTAVYHPTEEQ